MKYLALPLVALSLLAAIGINPSQAGPIADGSVFNITGAATFTTTEVDFTNPSSVTLGSGDFVSFGVCPGCATMTTPLIFSPFTPGLIYTATNGGITTTFTIDGIIDAPVMTANTLILHDSGTATLTGFDDTPGEWIFTMNEFGKLIGSFSSTAEAQDGGGGGGGELPEPASMAVLGVGLAGLGWIRRRRRT